ncbi:MAG TPA: PASTA domain-containing protein, partial [Dermatophilaceae bacterium]|nr:PASTA domain-containing protein [Dermatophilaceae bacterium]
ATAQIKKSDVVGKSAGVAISDLTTLGFTNVVSVQADSSEPSGTVIDVSPTGPKVALTERITLTVSNGSKAKAGTTPAPTTGASGG